MTFFKSINHWNNFFGIVFKFIMLVIFIIIMIVGKFNIKTSQKDIKCDFILREIDIKIETEKKDDNDKKKNLKTYMLSCVFSFFVQPLLFSFYFFREFLSNPDTLKKFIYSTYILISINSVIYIAMFSIQLTYITSLENNDKDKINFFNQKFLFLLPALVVFLICFLVLNLFPELLIYNLVVIV